MVGAAPRSCEWTRTNNHPINSRALYQVELRRNRRPHGPPVVIRQGPTPSSRRPPTGGGRLPVRARAEPHALRRPGRAVRSQCAPAVSNCGNRPLSHRGRRGSYRHGREDKNYSLASSVQFLNIHPYRKGMGSAHATPLVLGLFSEPIGIALPHPRAVCHRGDGAGGGVNQPTRQKGRNRTISSPCPADMRNNSTLRGAPVNPNWCDVRLTSEHSRRNALNRTGARSTGRTATTPMTRGAQPQELAARQRIQY